jgi:hypothetical protein
MYIRQQTVPNIVQLTVFHSYYLPVIFGGVIFGPKTKDHNRKIRMVTEV